MIRLLIVLACVVFFAVCLGGMRLGWVHRARRQSGLPVLPAAPADPGPPLAPPMTGLYVGTTSAENWQDRVVAHSLGLRADATATLSAAGLLIERAGAQALFIPAGSIVGAGLGAGLAGKVMGPGGLLIVRWRPGASAGTGSGEPGNGEPGTGLLDTGLRADDKSLYPEWVAALDRLTGRPVTDEVNT